MNYLSEAPADFRASEVTFAKMAAEHLESLVQIEALSFGAAAWTREGYEREIQCGFGCYDVALWRGDVLGCAGGWFFYGEYEITNVVIAPGFRGLGVGERLFYRIIKARVDDGCEKSCLEVSCNNPVAQKMYARFGYEIVGRRKHYYANGDDAWRMALDDMQSPAYAERLKSIAARWQ